MKWNQMFNSKGISLLLLSAIPSIACAGGQVGQVGQVNAQFARDVYASRASILIIGDSTNTPRGAGDFVPYYEGLIQSLPAQIDLCGFRVSGSSGNIGVNGYINFSSGSNSQMQGGRIWGRTEGDFVRNTIHSPPGYRNEFTIVAGGSLSSVGHFASVGLVNLAGIYPGAQQWGQGSTLVLRTPFFVSSNQATLPSISMSLISDHDGSSGNLVSGFDVAPAVDVVFESDRFGLQMVDAIFPNPQTTRIGVRFSGDLDVNDSNEAEKTVAWSDYVLFDQNRAILDTGVYFDSVSIGGYTARDYFETLDPVVFDDYLAIAPRAYSTILIWLGQNTTNDEWNGNLLPAWGQRIEAIADLAIQAAVDAGSIRVPVPVLVTPPLANGVYPSDRFSAMNTTLAEIATRRGWGHIDLQTLVGDALSTINPAFIGSGPHPSQEGSLFLTSLIYAHLDCLRAEYTGDSVRNFFDVSAFLTLFANMDPQADLNGDGIYNFFDISAFLDAFSTQCP